MDDAKDTPSVDGLPTSLEEAEARGAKFFFTDKPCRHGHIAPRYTKASGCLECRRISSAASYERNREKLLKKWADLWRDDPSHRKAKLAYSAEHFEKNKHKRREKDRLRAAAYRAANPEKVKQIVRNHFINNREAYRLNSAAYKAANLEKCRELTRQWMAANPEMVKNNVRNRHARIRSAEGRHTAEDVAAIIKAQRGKCAYCRTSTRRSYHVDHITAISKGGSNHPKNLQILCPSCNQKKHAKDPIDFAQQIGLLL